MSVPAPADLFLEVPYPPTAYEHICWADTPEYEIPEGTRLFYEALDLEPPTPSCKVDATTPIGLCDRHYVEIFG